MRVLFNSHKRSKCANRYILGASFTPISQYHKDDKLKEEVDPAPNDSPELDDTLLEHSPVENEPKTVELFGKQALLFSDVTIFLR